MAGWSADLWIAPMETPAGYFSPTLSEVRWFTSLAPQSCFNEEIADSPVEPHTVTEWIEFLPQPGF